MKRNPLTRIVRSQARGRTTVPVEFSERLGIDRNTLLLLTLRGSKIEITPVQLRGRGAGLRDFDREELDAFLQEDKINPQTAAKVQCLLVEV